MMSRLSPSANRLLALGLTFGVIALVWFAMVAPMIDLFASQAETLAQRNALYQRAAALADNVPALQAAAEAGGARGSPLSALVAGGSDAVAGASLQQNLQEMAASAGAVLSSTETLATTPVQGYRRIGLRVSLAAPWPVLIALLRTIDQATPRLLIDDLQVQGRTTLGQPVDAVLDAAFTVLAFRADTR